MFDLALMIYLTNYLLIPKLLYRKKYVLFGILFFVMIGASSIIKINILSHVLNSPVLADFSVNLKQRLYDNVIPHFILVFAGASVKLMFDYSLLQQRMASIAKEKAETELNFLKSQINPHFVFNSLNSVYFLIDKENTNARTALHKFSEMLRYQLYEMNGDRIPIGKEISYLSDYMDLQQLRKDEKYIVKMNRSSEVNNFRIEPLLLIPFVENAFKHISHHAEGNNFVNVSLSRMNGTFLFEVENSKGHEQTTEKPGGIGLNNVKRRLELLYPFRYKLNIIETIDTFKVQLNLEV